MYHIEVDGKPLCQFSLARANQCQRASKKSCEGIKTGLEFRYKERDIEVVEGNCPHGHRWDERGEVKLEQPAGVWRF